MSPKNATRISEAVLESIAEYVLRIYFEVENEAVVFDFYFQEHSVRLFIRACFSLE